MEYKIALWKKKSQKGLTYCSGKGQIDGKEYQLTLFNNDKKGNEKAPDFNLIVRDSINTQDKSKLVEKGQKNSELEQVKNEEENKNPLRDEVFADFGQFVVEDEEMPF